MIDASKADGTMLVDIDPETLIDAKVGTYIAERARKGQVGKTETSGCSPCSGPP